MNANIKTALTKMFEPKALLITLVSAICIATLAYVNHGIIGYVIAIFPLFLVFDFVLRVYEAHFGLQRRNLFQQQDVPKERSARILHVSMISVFWGALMYCMIWFDDWIALATGVPLFGVTIFALGEWQGTGKNKPTA